MEKTTPNGNKYKLKWTDDLSLYDIIVKGNKITTINIMMHHEAVEKYIDEILSKDNQP